jgi:hypothetical protein
VTGAALALLLALAPPEPVQASPWRFVSRADLHVGVRPHALWTTDGREIGAGVTIQVTR